MRKYNVAPGKKFSYNFHDQNAQQTAFAVEGDLVECERSQVYVTVDNNRIHTVSWPWVVSKAVSEGILIEILE